MPEFENTANYDSRKEPFVQLGKSKGNAKQATDKKPQEKITISIKTPNQGGESISQPVEDSFVPGVLGEEVKDTKVRLSFSNRAKNGAGASSIHSRWHGKALVQESTDLPRASVGEINLNEDRGSLKDDFRKPTEKPELLAGANALREKSRDRTRQRVGRSMDRGTGRRGYPNKRIRKEGALGESEDLQGSSESTPKEAHIAKKPVGNESSQSGRRRAGQERAEYDPNKKRSDSQGRQRGLGKHNQNHSSFSEKGWLAKVKRFFAGLFGVSEPPKVKRRSRRRVDRAEKFSENQSRRSTAVRSFGSDERRGNRRRPRKRRDVDQISSSDPTSRGRVRNANRGSNTANRVPRNASSKES